MNDKKRPIAERIAALMGKTSYRDIRDCGGSGFAPIKDEDVAAALGMVQHELGPLTAQVLETYFGSTLMHELTLRRTWDNQQERKEHGAIVVSRMGAALAVRGFAGVEYGKTELVNYAWIIHTRKEALIESIKLTECWLDEMLFTGLRELRNKLAVVQLEKKCDQKKKAA